MRPSLCLGLACWLIAVAAQADEPVDIDAFCASLRAPAPKVDLIERKVYTLPSQSPLAAIAMSADMKRFVTADHTGNLYVWNTKTGEVISELNVKPTRSFRSLAMTSDGKFVLAGSTGAGGWVIDADTGKKTFSHYAPRGTVLQAMISNDDKWAVMVTDRATFHRYPLHGGQGISSSPENSEIKTFEHVGITPDATRAVILPMRIKELIIQRFSDSEPEQFTLPLDLRAHTSLVLATKSYAIITSHGHRVRALSYPTIDEPRFHSLLLPTSQDKVRWLGITPDERWLMLVSDRNTLELRPSNAPAYGRLFSFPTKQPQCITMGADGRTFLIGDAEGSVHALRLTGEPSLPIQRAGVILQDLLAQARYLELEAIAAHFERETSPLPSAPNESPYFGLGELLTQGVGLPDVKRDIDQQLDLWIERRADAKLPRILRARRYIATAWEKRGSGVAAAVTLQGWLGFRDNIAKAKAMIEPVVDEQKPIPAAYGIMGIIAMAESWGRERMKAYEDRILEEAPLDLFAHGGFLQARMPRWGGAPDDYHEYAARVADKIGGEAGDGMYTRLCISQIGYYTEKDFDEVARLDYERFERGLLHLAKHASDQNWARHFGLRIAHRRLDKESAQAFAALINTDDLKDNWDPKWWTDRSEFELAFKYGSE